MNTEMENAALNTEVPAESQEVSSSANISTEVIIYRTYGKFDEKGDVQDMSVLRQSKDGKNWKAAEEKGLQVLAENQYKFYKLTTEAGFPDLITDSEQRVYVTQKGIDALQTAAANQYQAEIDKDTKQFVNNGELIDLREAINEAPQRRVLSDEQKLLRNLSAIPADKAIALLEQLKAQLLAAQS